VTRLIQILHALALALLCAILAPLAYEVWHERPTFESGVRRTWALVGRAEQTMDAIEKGATTWQEASKQQSKSSTRILVATQQSLSNLSAFVSRTDSNINGTLLPRLSHAIDQQNDALLVSQNDLQANLKEMLGATQQLQRTMAAAETVIADPQIKQLIVDLDSNMKQLNLLLQSGTATADDVKRVADKFAEQYTKARNIYYAVFKEVLSVGSQGVQFVLKK